VSRSLQGLHRNSVVIFTALIALLAMHGLSSDHAMGVPGGGHMETAMEVSSSAAPGHVVTHQPNRSLAVLLEQSVRFAVTAMVASASEQMGHAGGMCVAILGVALLLWLLVRALRRRLVISSVTRVRAGVTFLARGQPPTARLCPSLVQLCILRT
jgi:hypothetical protein